MVTRVKSSVLNKKTTSKSFKNVVLKKLSLNKIFNKFLSKKVVKKTINKKNISAGIENKNTLKLKRAKSNPIILPNEEIYWQSRATFNPTAFIADGKVHIIYRAIGESDISVLGHASSIDGISIDDKSTSVLFSHYINKGDKKNMNVPFFYGSGGGTNGGAEDPRAVLIDGRIYVTYTMFDGWGSVRMALTSISLEDFLNKYWVWKEPVLISPPGEINKNWVLFSEKINGKYAILHSFYPKILIDYFDNLEELDGKTFIKSNNTRPTDTTRGWDSWFRGVGPAPIKTKYGWLVIYHAMDHKNPDRYRMGAMLLDLKDPTKVLYRSVEPILSPDEYYENNGFKSGVIYSCGAVVKDGILFVYYGGADFVSCVATADLELFIKNLMAKKAPILSTKKKGKK